MQYIKIPMLILAMLCAISSKASVHSSEGDTVRTVYDGRMEEWLQPISPGYLDGVVISKPWNGNWFVSARAGASAFIGTPLGCADLFDRVNPSFAVSVGKWFSPYVGTRVGYQGWLFKDSELHSQDYHHFHADLM